MLKSEQIGTKEVSVVKLWVVEGFDGCSNGAFLRGLIKLSAWLSICFGDENSFVGEFFIPPK